MKKILLLVIFSYWVFKIHKFRIARRMKNIILFITVFFIMMILGNGIIEEYHEMIQNKSREYLQMQIANENDVIKRWAETVDSPMILTNEELKEVNNNEIKVLRGAEAYATVILDELKKAEDYIHMEYFILKDDDAGKAVKDILIKKSREGVEVRLIYDGYGSLFLSRNYISQLKKAGVKITVFSPIYQGISNMSLNHRNHRKMMIVDGRAAVMGGSNIADEYFGESTSIGKMKNTDIYIKGDAVEYLQFIFLRDWYINHGEVLLDNKYFDKNSTEGKVPVQIISGGLDSHDDSIQRAYFSMFREAKKELLIVTPYLIPTNGLMDALKDAVMRGVKIKFIIPDKGDNIVAQYATKLYAQDLLSQGIEVYKYTNGFIHSKVIIKDNNVSMVGTANFDSRGLKLDYEVIAFIYDQGVTTVLKNGFYEDLRKSKKITLNYEQKISDKLGRYVIHMIAWVL